MKNQESPKEIKNLCQLDVFNSVLAEFGLIQSGNCYISYYIDEARFD